MGVDVQEHTLLSAGLAQILFQNPHSPNDDSQFLVGAISEDVGGFPFIGRPVFRQAVAQQVVDRDAQRISNVYDGRQAQLCGTAFNVGDVGRLQLE